MHPAVRALSWKSTQAAVPSDAQLRKRAAALGITPPMSNRELRRHTDDVALEAALGRAPASRHQARRGCRRRGHRRRQAERTREPRPQETLRRPPARGGARRPRRSARTGQRRRPAPQGGGTRPPGPHRAVRLRSGQGTRTRADAQPPEPRMSAGGRSHRRPLTSGDRRVAQYEKNRFSYLEKGLVSRMAESMDTCDGCGRRVLAASLERAEKAWLCEGCFLSWRSKRGRKLRG